MQNRTTGTGKRTETLAPKPYRIERAGRSIGTFRSRANTFLTAKQLSQAYGCDLSVWCQSQLLAVITPTETITQNCHRHLSK
jgi:hypothetical protein